MGKAYTTREIGELLGVEEWRIRRLFEVGRLPEPDRFAGKRAIDSESIPTIIDALRERNWMPAS
jgi:predicted site-specific integrase-resolvase